MGLLSINCTAMVLSVTLIVITAAVVLGVTLSGALAAGEDSAKIFSRAATSAGVDKISNFLDLPALRFFGLSHASATGALGTLTNVTNDTQRAAVLLGYANYFRLGLFETDFNLLYVAAGFADGSWTDCGPRSGAGRPYACWMSDLMNSEHRTLYNKGRSISMSYNGVNLTTASTPGNTTYNASLRPWYVNAPKTLADAKRAFFSNVYIDASYTRPVVDVNSPFFDPARVLVGVSSLTLDLRKLSSFLASLRSTGGSESILIDNDGMLLGASNEMPVYDSIRINTTERNLTADPMPADCAAVSGNALGLLFICRHRASTFPHNAAIAALGRDYNDVTRSDGTRKLALAGKNYYVTSAAVVVANSANVQWRMTSLVPEDDVIGAILQSRDLALILTAVVIVASSVICAAALYFLLRPLGALAVRMEETATLRDDLLTENGTRSRLRELHTIQDAFYKLCGQLKKAKSFLPETLLAQLAADDDDEEEDLGSLELGSVSGTSAVLRSSDAMSGSRCHNGQTMAHSGTMAAASRSGTCPDRLSVSARTARSGTSDTRTTKSSRSTRTNNSNGMTPAAIADLGLGNRTVTVVALNVRGFHDSSASKQLAVLGVEYGMLVDRLRDTAKEVKGVLDSYHGDRFFVTFNGVRPCGSHASHGAVFAFNATRPLYHGLRLAAGVATGPAVVGNMGSASQKHFCTVGHAYTQAALLERLTRHYQATEVLLNTHAAADAESTCELLHVDLVSLPGLRVAPMRISAAKGVHRRTNDEWMYELVDANRASKYAAANKAMLHLLEGDLTQGEAALELFTTDGPDADDVRALLRRWIANNGVPTSTSLGDFYEHCVLGHTGHSQSVKH